MRRARLHRAVGALAAAAALTLSAACGDSPTSPSSTLNLAGSWTGTWTFIAGGATVTDAVTATVTQNGANVLGDWTAASGASGQFSFSAGPTVAGSLTISQTLVGGGTCTGTTSISGTAGASAIAFTLSAIPSSGPLCQWATGNAFALEKQ